MTQRRPQSIRIRLSDAEKNLLDSVVNRTGLTMSDLVRLVVFTFIHDIVEEQDKMSSLKDMLSADSVFPPRPRGSQ